MVFLCFACRLGDQGIGSCEQFAHLRGDVNTPVNSRGLTVANWV